MPPAKADTYKYFLSPEKLELIVLSLPETEIFPCVGVNVITGNVPVTLTSSSFPVNVEETDPLGVKLPVDVIVPVEPVRYVLVPENVAVGIVPLTDTVPAVPVNFGFVILPDGVKLPVDVSPSSSRVVYKYFFVPLNVIFGRVPDTDTLPAVPVIFPDTVPCGVKLPVDVKPFAAIEPLRYTFVPVNVGVDANAALAPVIALSNVIVKVSVDVSTLAFLQNDDVVGVTVTFGFDTVPAGL